MPFNCDECNKEYFFHYPCIHHLTDSPRDRKRYAEWRASVNKSKEVVTDHKQKGL